MCDRYNLAINLALQRPTVIGPSLSIARWFVGSIGQIVSWFNLRLYDELSDRVDQDIDFSLPFDDVVSTSERAMSGDGRFSVSVAVPSPPTVFFVVHPAVHRYLSY